MPIFSVNPALLLSPTDEGYLAYDTSSNHLHELNPTAALLIELCNGVRTTEEVIQLASPLLPPNSEPALLEWLNDAAQQDLLLENSIRSQKTQTKELTVKDLCDLADRLRDEGRVQAAFLCQKRATEIQPNDATLLSDLGELAHIIGKRDAARTAYESYLLLKPDDAEIQHLLTSLRDNVAPSRVPDECIHQLYERFSDFYESNMCEDLDYNGPTQLRKVIDQTLGDRSGLNILDLGCGTGLAGLEVADRAARLVGVDLSPEMIAKAKEQNIYDEFHIAEVSTWLETVDEKFDLIMACDTLIYFGDLQQVIIPAVQLLTPNGIIAFSVELAETTPYSLTDNGRYVHHPDHIQTVAKAANMQIVHQAKGFLRMEYGEEVTGLFVTLKPLANVTTT